MNIRTTFNSITASGGRTGWLKIVTSVDKSLKDGYAFEGDFIKTGVEVEVPAGAIMIMKNPTGSAKSNNWEGIIYRVLEKPVNGGWNDHLEYLDSFNWTREFLSFRDAVADYILAANTQKPEEQAIPSQKMAKEQLIELIKTEAITLTDVIDAIVEINGIVGVGLISLADDVNDYIRGK